MFQIALPPGIFDKFNVKTSNDVKKLRFCIRGLRRCVGPGIYQHENARRIPMDDDVVEQHSQNPVRMSSVIVSTDLNALLDRQFMKNNQEMQFVLNSSLLQCAYEEGECPKWINLNALSGIVADLKQDGEVPGVTKSELIFGKRGSTSALQSGLLEMAQIIFLMPHSYPKVSFLMFLSTKSFF